MDELVCLPAFGFGPVNQHCDLQPALPIRIAELRARQTMVDDGKPISVKGHSVSPETGEERPDEKCGRPHRPATRPKGDDSRLHFGIRRPGHCARDHADPQGVGNDS